MRKLAIVSTTLLAIIVLSLIACSQPCNVGYAAAYSRYRPQLTRFAASWEFQGDNFSLILQYEFENHILAALGYDMTWR